MSDNEHKTSRVWYVLAAMLLVIGGVAGVTSVRSLVDATTIQRVTAPGELELTLEKSGRYTLFFETRKASGPTGTVTVGVKQPPPTPTALRYDLYSKATGDDYVLVQRSGAFYFTVSD